MKNGETKLKKLKNIGVNKTYVLFSLYILGFLGFSFLFANMLSDKGKIIKDLETEKTQLTIDQKDLLTGPVIIADINNMLCKQFGIGHGTIQLETGDCDRIDILCQTNDQNRE